MKNSELDKLLQSVPVPEREAEFWQDFPKSVTRRLAQVRSSSFSLPARHRIPALAWAVGLATACIVLGFALGFWKGRDAGPSVKELAAMHKYYREITSLFPNQVRAIVIDENGPRLTLADTAEVPPSPPVYLKIFKANDCQRFITFSGQQVPVNGDLCDVLTDSQGHVLVVGRQLVWTSLQPNLAKPPYRIQAQMLEAAL